MLCNKAPSFVFPVSVRSLNWDPDPPVPAASLTWGRALLSGWGRKHWVRQFFRPSCGNATSLRTNTSQTLNSTKYCKLPPKIHKALLFVTWQQPSHLNEHQKDNFSCCTTAIHSIAVFVLRSSASISTNFGTTYITKSAHPNLPPKLLPKAPIPFWGCHGKEAGRKMAWALYPRAKLLYSKTFLVALLH